MREANAGLGRFFEASGQVIRGAQRGRRLGVPTANLDIWPEHAIPRNGIYACQARVGAMVYPAVTNIGTRPTFDNGARTVEAHLLDFDGDLYGQTMTLDVIEYQRPEEKYDNVQALVAQMQEDIRVARRILAGLDGAAGP